MSFLHLSYALLQFTPSAALINPGRHEQGPPSPAGAVVLTGHGIHALVRFLPPAVKPCVPAGQGRQLPIPASSVAAAAAASA